MNKKTSSTVQVRSAANAHVAEDFHTSVHSEVHVATARHISVDDEVTGTVDCCGCIDCTKIHVAMNVNCSTDCERYVTARDEVAPDLEITIYGEHRVEICCEVFWCS